MAFNFGSLNIGMSISIFIEKYSHIFMVAAEGGSE